MLLEFKKYKELKLRHRIQLIWKLPELMRRFDGILETVQQEGGTKVTGIALRLAVIEHVYWLWGIYGDSYTSRYEQLQKMYHYLSERADNTSVTTEERFVAGTLFVEVVKVANSIEAFIVD